MLIHVPDDLTEEELQALADSAGMQPLQSRSHALGEELMLMRRIVYKRETSDGTGGIVFVEGVK